MIDRSLAIISNKTRRSSLALRNDLRSSFRVERALEKNSLAIKSKLLEDRDRTLKALALRSTQKEKDNLHLHILSLMKKPEYFQWTVKRLLNIELLPEQVVILQELWT